jgi:PKD repeat protein
VYYCGGNYGFSGINTAVTGTFYFDFSDLARTVSGAKRWFVSASDLLTGSPTTISSFKLYRATASGDVLVATSGNTPVTIDGSRGLVWLDYAYDSSNQPPQALIEATPTTGQAPLTVNFDGSGSSVPNGQIESYSWDFGDNSAAGSGAQVSHVYTSNGLYTVTLTVTDNKGLTGFSRAMINAYNPNRAPELDPIGNKNVNVNQTLSFTVTASDPDGNALTYTTANLPSGSSYNTAARTFSWTPSSSQVGTYSNVYFQVSDGKLADSEYISITVSSSMVVGQIAGTVKDAATGQGIPGAVVTCGSRSTSSGAGGTYTLTSVPAGSGTVTAQASGYQSQSQTVAVAVGQTAAVNFNLAKTLSNTMWVDSITFAPGATDLTIYIKVVNPQPVAGAVMMINLVYNGVLYGRYSATTGTDGVGIIRVSPARNGNYTATVIYLARSGYTWDTTQGIKNGKNVLSR